MKRMISHYNKYNINIQVNFEVDSAVVVSASMISSEKDGLDDQSLADYLTFVDEAKNMIEDNDLIIVEQSESKSSKTSKYLTLANLTKFVSRTMKFFIFLRISNHVPTEDEEVKSWIKKIREDTAKKYNIKWKVRNIIVNNTLFSNYDDALEYVEKCVQEYKHALK